MPATLGGGVKTAAVPAAAMAPAAPSTVNTAAMGVWFPDVAVLAAAAPPAAVNPFAGISLLQPAGTSPSLTSQVGSSDCKGLHFCLDSVVLTTALVITASNQRRFAAGTQGCLGAFPGSSASYPTAAVIALHTTSMVGVVQCFRRISIKA